MDNEHRGTALKTAAARRRARHAVRRRCRVEFSLTEDEYAKVRAAAHEAGLANGAYAARATLARRRPRLFRRNPRSGTRWRK